MSLARSALVTVAAVIAVATAYAQAPPPPPLPDATPAAVAPPPLPPDIAGDPDLEPQVTIVRREDNVIEEVRVKGELRFIRVTPNHGRPYFLVPDASGHAFIRRDSHDIALKVPMWVLFSF
jgi:Protein of unknown function (DUF2782)